MQHKWTGPAAGGVVALAGALVGALALVPAAAARPQTSLPSPLSAQAFTGAVLGRNASLEAMRQAVAAAVARIRPAGALDDPMLSVSVAPRSFGSTMGAGGEVEVSQSLPWWGTLDARAEVARAQAEAARHDFDGLQLRLAALARGEFSDWVFIHRALAINTANQTVLAELRSIARVRYTTGQAPQGDILQADVERAMLRQQRLELERDRSAVQARMNALLERAPELTLPEPAELPSNAPLPAEEVLAQRALAHPQLEQLEAEEQVAAAQQRLAEKEGYPRFALSAGYNSMWPDPAMRPMVGVSMTMPLDRGKYRADIDAARAEAHRAASTLEDRRAALLADLASAYASAKQAARSLELYRDQLVPLARDDLEVVRTEYANGRGDFLNVLAAEQRQLDAELGLARMQSEYYQRLAELEQVSGGASLLPGGRGEGADP